MEAELEVEKLEAEKLEDAEKRAVFYEEAARPEIGCTNARVAYAIALSGNLFIGSAPDWAALRKTCPEIFIRR